MKQCNTWRSILRIAKIELNTMFCSPVPWLVLVVFTFQTGLAYSNLLNNLIHQQAMGEELTGITGKIFGAESYFGRPMADNFFNDIINYLFLYLPLLTMGLLSREYNSGTVKLLFSSPIRNSSIVLGKFGAMLVYGGILVAVLCCYVIYSGCVIENFDWPQAWAGILGIFLLICTYSAIGLFMSSVTSYPVVAGVGTLALLAVLNYIGGVGQNIDFVRDITYWLALSGKMRNFILGIVPSESVIYFIALIVFFLAITTLRLEDKRTRRNRNITLLRYAMAVCLLAATSYISSRPTCKFYYDATRIQSNTLSRESQEVLHQLDGPLKMTTYVNVLDFLYEFLLPVTINEDMKRFQQYTRFKPEMKMEYVYFWDEANNKNLKEKYPDMTNQELAEMLCKVAKQDFASVLTPEQIRAQIDLSSENNRTTRLLERGNGERVFLRESNDHDIHPMEPEITAALKRLGGKTTKIVFAEGHGDRTITNENERGFKSAVTEKASRSSLINTGFESVSVNLEKDDIPSGTEILVITSPQTPLPEEELQKVNDYVNGGGNLLLLAEYGRQQNMTFTEDLLGIRFSNEVAVCPVKDQDPRIIWSQITQEAVTLFPKFAKAQEWGFVRKNVMNIDYSGAKDFRVTPLYVSASKGVWLEKETTDFTEDSVVFNPAAGEREGCYTFAATLDRRVGAKEQRIAVFSDPMLFTFESYHLSEERSANYLLPPTIMRWLSGDEFPIVAERDKPTDNRIYLKNSSRTLNTWLMTGIFPLLFLVSGVVIIRKRKKG